MSITPEQLAKWQALCDNATPEPWVFNWDEDRDEFGNVDQAWVDTIFDAKGDVVVLVDSDYYNYDNLELMRESRTAMPALLAAHPQLAARVAELEGEASRLRAALAELVTPEGVDEPGTYVLSSVSRYVYCAFCNGQQLRYAQKPLPHDADCPITVARRALSPLPAVADGKEKV